MKDSDVNFGKAGVVGQFENSASESPNDETDDSSPNSPHADDGSIGLGDDGVRDAEQQSKE